MSMTKFYVYKITNKINNKIYIGKSKNPNKRFQIHISIAKRQYKKFNQFQAIHGAISKYGSENFILDIIEECASEKDAFLKEELWINKLSSRDRKLGYNLTKGGSGAVGRIMTQKQKDKLSKDRMAEGNPMFGKTISDDTRKKLSDFQSSRERQPLSQEHLQSIKLARAQQDMSFKIPKEVKEEIINLYQSGNYTKKQLAEKFNMKYNSVVKIIRKHKERAIEEENNATTA